MPNKNEELIKCAMNNNIEVVKKLLLQGANPNYEDTNGYTTLIWAARYGHLEIVKELLAHKANINAKNHLFETPLISAIRYISWSEEKNPQAMKNRMELINLLLINGANINDADLKGQTALMITDKCRYLEIKKILENFNLNKNKRTNDEMNNIYGNQNSETNVKKFKKVILETNIQDSNNSFDRYDLINAVQQGNTTAVYTLLNTSNINVNYVNQNGDTALIIASRYGYFKIVELLIVKGSNVNHANNQGNTALIESCKINNFQVTKDLLNVANIDINFTNKNGDTALIWAIRNDQIEKVKVLLTKGSKVNHANNQGNTALIESCSFSNSQIIIALLNVANIDVNFTNKDGDTALIWAIRNDQIEKVKVLLTKGSNVNHANNQGNTALIESCSISNSQIIIALLNVDNIDINFTNNNGDTALIWATRNDQIEKVKILLTKGSNVNHANNEGNTALIESCYYINFQITKTLLNHNNIDVNLTNNKGDTALIIAATYVQVEKIKILLAKGANVIIRNNNNQTALLSVVEKFHLSQSDYPSIKDDRAKIVKELLIKGASINEVDTYGDNVLTISARNGYLKVVQELIMQACNLNQFFTSLEIPLISAITYYNSLHPINFSSLNDRVEIVKILLENGAKIESRNNRGETPLILAAQKSNLTFVKILLAYGANVNHLDIDNNTALIWAARYGQAEIVKILLAHDAKIDLDDKNGDTALMRVSNIYQYSQLKYSPDWISSYTEILKILLNNGANVNHSNNKGETALIIATKNNNLFFVNTLLEKGADVNFVDTESNTALIIAAENNFCEIISELLGYGANVMHRNDNGDSALIIANKCTSTKASETLKNFLNFKNWIQEKIDLSVHEINNIIDDIETMGNNKIYDKEKKLINLLERYKKDLGKKFTANGILNDNVRKFLKKEFINNLEVEDNYSLLHLAIFNKMGNLADWLIEFGIDTKRKDSTNLTVWHYACLLLVPEIAFAIKPDSKLTQDDQQFFKEFVDLKLAKNNNYLNDENDDYPRNIILDYYDWNLNNELQTNKNQDQANSSFFNQDTATEWSMSM